MIVPIKRQVLQTADGPKTVFSVPAIALNTGAGKRLIPNPAGTEAMHFPTLEEAEAMIRRAGFESSFEGRTSHPVPTSGGALVPLLLERLQDREPVVVANTIIALGNLNVRHALEPIAALMGHEDAGVRKQVVEYLAKQGKDALPLLKRAFHGSVAGDGRVLRLTVMQTYLELASRSPELHPELLKETVDALNDENWLVRAQAALVAGYLAGN
jgi:hypothetical protein